MAEPTLAGAGKILHLVAGPQGLPKLLGKDLLATPLKITAENLKNS
jgi:hypothetical protein